MSLIQSTYKLCKKIQSIQLRSNIKDLIYNLNTTSDKGIGNKLDRSILGYLAKNYNLEFLGYLVTHEKREQIKKAMPMINIAPLTDSEVSLFEQAHSIITQINTKCITKLLEIFPNSEIALDNYVEYPYKFVSHHASEINEIEKYVIELTNEFEKHPSYIFIRESIKKFPRILDIPKEYLLATIIMLRKDLLKNDPIFVSKETNQILELSHRIGEQSDLIRIILSLFCIRLSLKNLDKLLYMSFFKDKLSVLNNDTVFNIRLHHKNILGEFIILENQPSDIGSTIIPTEIILVKLETNNCVINSPYFINNYSFSLTSKYGSTQEFNLRKVDEHLNIISTLYYK